MMARKTESKERYGDNEAQERFHKALKGAFKAPHKPAKAMRKGLPSQSKKQQEKGNDRR